MGNIVTYIQKEQRTFAESPFNPVDSLILATLSYVNFEVGKLVAPSSPERALLHDTLYELFASTEAATWSEFQAKLGAHARQMLGQGSRLDAETRSFIFKTLGSLAAVLKNETIKRFRPVPPEWLPRRRERYEAERLAVHNPSNDTCEAEREGILPA